MTAISSFDEIPSNLAAFQVFYASSKLMDIVAGEF